MLGPLPNAETTYEVVCWRCWDTLAWMSTTWPVKERAPLHFEVLRRFGSPSHREDRLDESRAWRDAVRTAMDRFGAEEHLVPAEVFTAPTRRVLAPTGDGQGRSYIETAVLCEGEELADIVQCRRCRHRGPIVLSYDTLIEVLTESTDRKIQV